MEDGWRSNNSWNLFRSEYHIDSTLKQIQYIHHTTIVLCGTICILATSISSCQLILGYNFVCILWIQIWSTHKQNRIVRKSVNNNESCYAYGKKSCITNPTAPYFFGWLCASQIHRFIHSCASSLGMLGRSSTERSTQPINDSETPTNRLVIKRESEPFTFSEFIVRPIVTVKLVNPRIILPTVDGISEKVRLFPIRGDKNVGSIKDSTTSLFNINKPFRLLSNDFNPRWWLTSINIKKNDY